MFLITTADQRFWKTDGPVLFLGEWCKIFSERPVWEKLRYEVLPYHWDDREKLYRDYLYLNRLYEEVLEQLCTCFNEIHGEDRTTRYWRIIIGPWLFYFIEILFDRYQSLVTAELSGKVANTYITKAAAGQWIPKDFDQFISFFINEEYNHYLYSRIIEIRGRVPWEFKNVSRDQPAFGAIYDRKDGHAPSLKRLFMEKLKNMCRGLSSVFTPKIVFVSSYFSRSDQIKLELALGQAPYLFPPNIDIPNREIDLEMRKKIRFHSPGSEFVELLYSLLPEQIPQCYLESYRSTKERALREFPSKPRMILTANAHIANEGFKVWSASSVEKGTLLLGTQHGGCYGTALWMANEEHEYSIYDRYYSWGWSDPAEEKIKPMPAVKLNSAIKLRPVKNGRILLVNMCIPRYSYWMYSIPVAATGYNRYLDNIFEFIKSLENMPRKLLLTRLYPEDYGFNQRERFVLQCPDIECYLGNRTMYEQLNESRLFIGTYNATTYLETFSANFPTVLFWDPASWEMRPEARPYFEKLHAAGIFHDTPESAARLVNEICSDPLEWWNQPRVQEAKKQFCDRFAHTSRQWLAEWKKELHDLSPKWGK